ncbi:MAG: hypothetical protein ACE5JG_09975, partial [Planctomycetota bacterium]
AVSVAARRGPAPPVKSAGRSSDAKGVARLISTAIGIAILLGGFLLIRPLLDKKGEARGSQPEEVLTGLASPRLASCRILEDDDLPDGLAPPGVDQDLLYLSVVIHYPGAARAPDLGPFTLRNINGRRHTAGLELKQLTEVDEKGAYVEAIFRVDSSFRYAEVHRGPRLIVERAAPG